MGQKNKVRKPGERLTGTVRWFHPAKGYGFLACDMGGPDVFVHYSGIAGDGYRALEEGQAVSYMTEVGRNEKLQATNVMVEEHG